MIRQSLIAVMLMVLSLAVAGGCADDLHRKDLFDAGGGEVSVSFSVEKVGQTRADASSDIESDIGHAYLLFYSSDSEPESSLPLAAVRAEVDGADPGALRFKMPLRLQADTDYRVLAVANADDYVPEGFGSFAEYVQSWSEASSGGGFMPFLYRADRMDADFVSSLPMRGIVEGGGLFRFSNADGAVHVSASLSFRRLVARIDVHNRVSGFELEGVALCNWRDAVSLTDDAELLGNGLGNVRGVLADGDADSGSTVFTDMPAFGSDGTQRLERALYCFPSVAYDAGAGDRKSTCLIIKARYGEDAESSYYRVNVGASGNKSEVKANVKYTVAIQSVKGRGAATPEEAYSADESQLVLSVVEDWDLEGSFAMDEYGNFIVLSSGSLEFEGDSEKGSEVKVLSSRGMSLSLAFMPDDEVSEGAFSGTLVEGSPLSAVEVKPTGKNSGDSPLSGTFTVSAATPQGGRLSVGLFVAQMPASAGPDEPAIPSDMPFALIPGSYDRVKIDHEKRTIEIDGFDPDCFNSFIDVPFKVYINEAEGDLQFVNISTSLEWPLEGRVSLDHSSQYVYRKESFGTNPQVSDADGNAVAYAVLATYSFPVEKDGIVNISVGAMGPDDPAIMRTVTLLGSNGKRVEYELCVKPSPCIINDVILTAPDGSPWLIMDRNIQDLAENSYKDYIGFTQDGKKHQAYNYSYMNVADIHIPFKFFNATQALSEKNHELYLGKSYQFVSKSQVVNLRLTWLKEYSYSNDNLNKVSPFYEEADGDCCYTKWIFPTETLFDVVRSNLKVSKMRMYLVSDVAARSGGIDIPVCCYLPYYFAWANVILDQYNYGYYTSANGTDPDKIIIIYFENKEGVTYSVPTNNNQFFGLSRLVRPLTEEELNEYKVEYLGYGDKPHRMTLCHPDTYESTSLGWLPY